MKYQEWSTAPVCPGGRLALEAAGVPPLLALVLSARGVESADQARRLLDPAGETLLDPMGMAGMDRAVDRVRLALERKESIAVYGDYDVDGITSTCLLLDVLTRRGGQVTAYIPDRLEEGYGLNREAAERLARAGVSLIITVDCGITAVEEVAYAKELGMDVVITDHHACKDTLPPAQAVVNPQRPDCPYPFKGLAGVGVALKLAMAVAGPEGADAVFSDYCDLAAVGTVADVMPMTGENRAIVRAGLERLNPARRTGFAHLIRCAGVEDKPVTATSIGYLLAPRINAAGRMGQADVARELLLTQDDARAELLAQQLCELNRRRQTIEGDIFDQCVQRLDRDPQSGVIVLAGEQWHQGVVGIVASRLTEKYGCPAFMICLDHGLGKGSCRSWGDVNLFRLLTAAAPLLENFGGHALAAGFTVREENIPALAQCLREELRRTSGGAVLPSVLEIDAAVSPQLLTVPEVEALDRLEPCGTGNPRPLLSISGAQVQFFSQVGRGRHLKLRLDARGILLDAIYFSANAAELGLVPGGRVDVAFYPQINEFRGSRTVQLQVADLRPAPTRAQMERALYDRFTRGEALTPQEAQVLLPEREEFAALWRWLVRQSAAGGPVEDALPRIARSVSRFAGRREAPVRTMLCLEVMEERGLLALTRRTDRLQITVQTPAQKVDLNASPILLRLRGQLYPKKEP